MKREKILLGLATATIAVSSFAIGDAYASGQSEPVTAYMSYDVSVKKDGEEVNMQNVKGERVYPIIYQGTTYIPIRAMGNLFNVQVNWDNATRTVLLGNSSESKVDFIDTFEPYASYDVHHNQKAETISGVAVNKWINFHWLQAYAYYNLGGVYNTLTFEVSATHDTILYIRGDNESVLKEVSVIANQVPQKVTVPLMGTTQLSLQTSDVGYGELYMINAYLS